jgi:hypothetical protein
MSEMKSLAFQTNIINHFASFSHLFTFLSFLFFIFLNRRLKGFLIIPKKVEQNQTKIFDRDKVTSVGNYTVPNSISDYNKNVNSFKSIKNTITSSSDGLTLNNATNNNSSNQLVGGNETELITFFSTTNFTNITSQVGSIVEIPCTVHHLGEGTVSVEHMKRLFDEIYWSPSPLYYSCSGPLSVQMQWGIRDHSTSCV